jgi:hypothetical protein
MEETLTPDVVINNTKLNIGNKTYSLYCKRKTKEQADLIKTDLIANGCDAILRQGTVEHHKEYLIWWRKESQN